MKKFKGYEYKCVVTRQSKRRIPGRHSAAPASSPALFIYLLNAKKRIENQYRFLYFTKRFGNSTKNRHYLKMQCKEINLCGQNPVNGFSTPIESLVLGKVSVSWYQRTLACPHPFHLRLLCAPTSKRSFFVGLNNAVNLTGCHLRWSLLSKHGTVRARGPGGSS